MGTRTMAMVLATVSAIAVSTLGPPARAVNVVLPHVVSENPADWTPNALDGQAYIIRPVGNRMFMGGSFTKLSNAGSHITFAQPYLVAFNATTGALDTTFRPVVNGRVQAIDLAPDGQSVYVGGYFTSVNGKAQRSIARLDAVTGRSWPGFTPAALNGGVDDVATYGSQVLVGGVFQKVGTTSRPALASLDGTTGAATQFLTLPIAGVRVTTSGVKSPLNIEDFDITADRSRLVILGGFDRVAGQPRSQIAVISLRTNPASLSPWATSRYASYCGNSFPTYVRGLDTSPDSKYVVVSATGGARMSALCDASSRFELSPEHSGVRETWSNHAGGDTLWSAAITGNVIYVGGHQRWLDNPFGHDNAGPGAVSRPGVGALDPATGKALAWNPTKTRGVATFDIRATPAGLWIVSDGDIVHKEYHGKVAFFPL
jgi:hypothetical protein